MAFYSDYNEIAGDSKYVGHISIIDGLVPAGSTNFPLMSANSIWIPARWNRYLDKVPTQPSNSVRVDKRIQQLEDDKVNRDGDLLQGNYLFTTGFVALGDAYPSNPKPNYLYAKGIYLDFGIEIKDALSVDQSNFVIKTPTTFNGDICFGTDAENEVSIKAWGEIQLVGDFKASTILATDNATFEKNVIVNGDLTVKGKTIAEQHTTVTVEDNLFVLNRYKIDDEYQSASTEDTGIVFCLGEYTYGLLLSNNGVISLGQGTLSSDANNNKSFVWTEGTVFPLALRDLSDSDHEHLLMWNKDNNHIVSSTKTIKDIQDEIDNDCAALEEKLIGSSSYKTIKALENAVQGKQDSISLDAFETKIQQWANDTFIDVLELGSAIAAHGFTKMTLSSEQIVITLPAGAEYHCETSIQSLKINSFISNSSQDRPSGINHYTIIFKIDESYGTEDNPFVFDCPTNVKWAGIAPIFEGGNIYKFTFIETNIDNNIYYLGEWMVYSDAI